MNAACLTGEEMHACLVRAGISEEQRGKIFHFTSVLFLYLLVGNSESKDKAYLVIQVSLYDRSDSNSRALFIQLM